MFQGVLINPSHLADVVSWARSVVSGSVDLTGPSRRGFASTRAIVICQRLHGLGSKLVLANELPGRNPRWRVAYARLDRRDNPAQSAERDPTL